MTHANWYKLQKWVRSDSLTSPLHPQMTPNETSPMLPLHAGAETRRLNEPPSQAPVSSPRPNWLSRLTFSSLSPLLDRGASQPLKASDLWPLESADDTVEVTNTLRVAINNSQSLKLSLRQVFFSFNMYLAGTCKLTGDCLTFVRPVCFFALIQYVESPTPAWSSIPSNGYIFSFVLFAASILRTLCLQQCQHLSMREATRVRAALTMLVYEKSLTLSAQTQSSVGLPKLMDLVTVDIDGIFKLWSKIHSVWAAGIHLVIGLILLTQCIGPASLVSAVIMILLPMVKSALSSLTASTSTKLADCTNKRLTFLTDLCQHIRVVKFYAWESELLGQVDALREEERRFQKKMVMWNACRSAIEQAGPVLVSFGTFAAYSYLESKPLTADKAFTAIALFSIIRPTLMTLPQVLPLICIATGSIKRVEAFLHLKQRERVPTARSSSFIDDPSFEIRHATFKWKDTEELLTGAREEGVSLPQLPNVTISVPKGKLTLVVGGAGSGKSALLAAILGELQPEYGVVRFPSRYISYAAQMPYIIDASVQENVLFGAPLDTARLHRVVKCCELEKELVRLPNGFQSEISKDGITLSDDQKQRLSIARALYPKEQELYVFDDPLSALDVHVATRIFHQCFSELTGGLLAGLTRVVSTHAVQFAHLADWIIVMDNMRVVEMGTYQDLTQVTANGKFASMLRMYHPAEEPVVERAIVPDDPAEGVETIQSDARSNSCVDVSQQDEEKSAGQVSWNVFLSYFVSCGTLSTVGAFALLFTKQVVSISTDFWLTKWTSNSAAGVDSVFYLTFYAYLGLSTISLGFVGELCCQYAGLRASKQVHHSFLHSVIKGTLRFFHTNSVGCILNRFSHDMYIIDEKLNKAIVQCVTTSLALLSMLVIQSSMAPMLLVLLILLFICSIWYQRYCNKSCLELHRLDRVSRCCLYDHFTQTLNGLATIRAFGVIQQSQSTAALKMNESTRALLSLNLVHCWLSVRLELLSALMTYAVAFFVSRNYLVLSSAMAGLLLCYSQDMTLLLDSIIRSSIDVTDMMTSVQRTRAYRHIESEPVTLLVHHYERFTSLKSRALQLRPHWPEHGRIDFVNVCVKYDRNALPALHGVSFSIEGGEKVGICGRAGAGKSTLLLALYRMVSFDNESSSIYIDQVCTTALTLTELRSRMAIIPRDPVLFAANVRFNLDPTRQSTDHEMWTALGKVGLEAFVKGLDGGLDAELEGGTSFSIGKRQLMGLARAILRNSRILCFDEATTAMDHETDERIQSTIRREFTEATVLTISRRVDTVLDYDKIVVLKEGRIVEIGPPSELRDKRNGEFAGIMLQTL